MAALAIAWLGLLAWPGGAVGQDSGTGEVTLTASWFGVGGAVRPGDWTGLRVGVQDTAERQREVLLRIAIPDADGDRALYEATLTTNPGVVQQQWMYVVLPARFRPTDALRVQAFAAIERPGAEGGRATYAAGRLLGSAGLQPRQVLERTDGMIGVVGARPMGLTRYSGLAGSRGLPGSHERTELVQRLDADAMPDRWMGLASMEALVWNDPAPGSLGTQRAAAVREWVERGGHLVVVLPRIGQSWTDEVNNPLYEITPRVRVERREGVDLARFRPMVTRSDELAMPRSEVVQVMTPAPGAAATEALPIIAGPDGEWIAVRRLAGAGMVTLVGLDVASRWMTERGMPEPEMFWHRVLGRRGELVQPKEGEQSVRLIDREPITLDRDVDGQIAKTGRAEIGVLLGLIVFVAYWLVAGPLGYAALKRTGRARHGWVVFVAAAGVFTAVAWGGAAAIRPARVEASHLTILDHVYGQPVQRARSWVSLLIPAYGEAGVSVGDPDAPGSARFTNLIAAWEPEGSDRASFPDARGYAVDSRAPERMTVPTRATVKQLRLDWAGGPAWKMPRPVGAEGEAEPELRLAGPPGERSTTPTKVTIPVLGALRHELPGPLEDVVVIVNRGQKPLTRGLRGGADQPWADVAAFKLQEAWKPGEALDLTALTAQESDAGYLAKLIQSDVGQPEGLTAPDNDLSRVTARLTAIGLLSQLQPPETRQDGVGARAQRLAQRRQTHGWDLGAWFAQPCVIVIGHVGAKDPGPASPVPLFVRTGGAGWRAVERSTGRTVVRWVYPLPADPPRVGGASGAGGEPAQGAPAGPGGGS